MRGLFLIVLLIISIAFIIFTASGGTSQSLANVTAGQKFNSLSPDEYVAIYQEYHEKGVIISGNGTVISYPEPCPRPRPFDYNGSLGYLEEYPIINYSLKIFHGDFKYYETPAISYVRASYGGIYSYPSLLESNLTVLDVDENGTIYANYNNQPVILNVGDVWQSSPGTRIENQTFQVEIGGNPFSGVYRPFTVQYNSSWSFENKGIFDKSDFKPINLSQYFGPPTPSPFINIEGVISIGIGTMFLIMFFRKGKIS